VSNKQRKAGEPKPTRVQTAPPHPSPRRELVWSWRREGLQAILVFVLTFAAFFNSIGNGFVYDDIVVIGANDRLDHVWNLGSFFTGPYWDNETDVIYRPLTSWSWALDRRFFGPGPLPVHLSNVIAGSLLTVLVYVFLLLLFQRPNLAFVAALLFGIHPVHTEVMASGVGRSEIYGALFLFLAATLHVYAHRRTAGSSIPIRVLSATAYFVAMFFKESTVILIALLFLTDWLVLEKTAARRLISRWPRYLFYVIPLAAFLAMRSSVVGGRSVPVQEVMIGFSGTERVMYASKTLLDYIVQLFFPWTLCAEYTNYLVPLRSSSSDPYVSLSLIAWVVIAFLWVRLAWRDMTAPMYGITWFFVTILPASNLLFIIGTVRADRLLFVPSLGFTLVLAWLILELGKRRRSAAWAVFLLLISFYGTRTVTRNTDWKSQESLWTADLKTNPGAAIGWSLLGDIYRDRGEFERAERFYYRAFELRDEIGFYPEAHNHYAALMNRKGNPAEAERHYRLVLSKQPDQFAALVNLGAMLVVPDSTREEAIGLLTRAIAATDDDVAPRINLTQAHDFNGHYDLALQTLDGAIRLEPTRSDLWDIRAQILGRAGRPREAEEATEQAKVLRAGQGQQE